MTADRLQNRPTGRVIHAGCVALSLVLIGGPSPAYNPGIDSSPRRQSARVQRLTYTITFLGVPVARALLDEARPGYEGGEWVVRGAARTTAFWEKFTHIHNSYVTRLRAPDFQPTVYGRQIDQKGVRFDRVEWYGPTGAGDVDPGRLPPLPDRYRVTEGEVAGEILSVPAGQGNFYSALWYLRYADWDRTREVVLPLWLEGQGWRVTISREGTESRRAPEGRVETWKLVCRLSRDPGASGDIVQQESVAATDHVTGHLMRDNAVLTFWIEQSPSRRPISVIAAAGVFRVSGHLREPFEDEEMPGGFD